MRDCRKPAIHRPARRRWMPASSAGAALSLLWAASAAVAAQPGWGDVPGPTASRPDVIGSYSRGCLAGGVELPADGPGWQVMRPSRGRFYGHPDLIRFVRGLAAEARAAGFAGLLVGDLAQPRGGPMASGHVSHQTGLDADVWFDPAPDRRLTADERETLGATSVVAADGRSLNGGWTEAHAAVLRAAARAPEVARIFVSPAIKRELCRAAGADRGWLRKVRPWWGHRDHFHVRLRCPEDSPSCIDQAPPPPGDGCDGSLAWWFSAEAEAKAEELAQAPPRPRPTLDDLPPRCRSVLLGP